jgi:spore coat polysaccharide biosynthesis protein SpsF (cytidylyltransferase family)
MGRHGAVIQARMGSSRLPGKSMLDLGGIKLVDWVIRYASMAFDTDDIVLATTESPEDDALVAHVKSSWNIGIYRGSSLNVLSRFIEIAKMYEFETITRVTADDPFKIPLQLRRAREVLNSGQFDYYCNFKPYLFPIGLDVEAFRTSALLDSFNTASSMALEHVTFDLREGAQYKKFFEQGTPVKTSTRLTIDTLEDLKFCSKVATFHREAVPFVSWEDLQTTLELLEIGDFDD